MSTSSTQRSREFGNRSAAKNLVQMEENDVFYSAAENVAIVGKCISKFEV